MLVHVACKANISGTEGVLTYRADQAEVGQLALVRLRGRRVPGIVMATQVPAGTSQAILPVLSLSDKVLPQSYLKWLKLVAQWYALPLSPLLTQIGAQLNGRYLFPQVKSVNKGSQRLWLTPSFQTPLARFLADKAEAISESSEVRRDQWWRSALGEKMAVVGTLAAVALPWQNLSEIVLESPFASPYHHDRSPGLHTSVLASLLAQATNAKLTIRSALPTSALRQRLPLPTNLTVTAPKYLPISVVLQKDRGQLNPDFASHIKDALAKKGRVLVYHNHLPGLASDGRPTGLKQLANRLTALLNEPVDTLTAKSPPPNARVVVTTNTTLYRVDSSYSLIAIPDVDGLASSNQPWSIHSAIETIGTLASRAPLAAQIKDTESLLAKSLINQLDSTVLEGLPWPKFDKRVVRYTAELDPPEGWLEIAREKGTRYCLTPRVFSPHDRLFIAKLREAGKVWSDDWTWPPVSDIVVQK